MTWSVRGRPADRRAADRGGRAAGAVGRPQPGGGRLDCGDLHGHGGRYIGERDASGAQAGAEDAALNAATAEKAAHIAVERREAETRRCALRWRDGRPRRGRCSIRRDPGPCGRPSPRPERGPGPRSVAPALESSLPHITSKFRGQPLVEARLRRTLGVSSLRLGEPRIAQEQLEAARALNAEFLGPDHADTLGTMIDVANSYAARGRHAEAVKLREQTLALAKAKLGPDHPNTLASMSNLAASYVDLGRYAEALQAQRGNPGLVRA